MTLSNSSFYDNDAIFLVANSLSDQGFGAPGNSTLNVYNNTFYNNTGSIIATINTYEGSVATTNFYNNTVFKNTPYYFSPMLINVNYGQPVPTYNAVINMRNNIFDQTLGEGSVTCLAPGDNASLASQGGNLVGDDTCTPYFTATNDKNSTSAQLGAFVLNNNTWVLPLLAGSPALENAVAGTPTTPSIDQRGVARPQAALADSGAYEYVYPNPDSGGSGGSLAGTGWDAKTPALVAGILVLSGILATGYALKRR